MSDRDLILITPDFPPNRGGVARYLDALATHFSDRMTVIAPKLGSNESVPTAIYPVIRQSLLFRFFWPRWIKSTVDLIRRQSTYRYVLTSHVLPFGVAAMIAQWITHKPYLVIVHGMDLRLALNSSRKKLSCGRALNNAYLVVANSNALAQELQQLFGLKNILVVYPSIDPSQAVTTKAESTSSIFRLLTVSRLVDRKGHDRVLTALAMLKLNGTLTSFTYDIVGSGPTRAPLEQLVEELGLQGHVHFLGDVDDVTLRDCYMKADLFVMPVKDHPIDKEGFGLVFLEAALFELPSISTNMSGVNEAIIDGETGLLIADNDLEALAKSIMLLAQDSTYRRALGTAAKERTLRDFTADVQYGKLDPYLL